MSTSETVGIFARMIEKWVQWRILRKAKKYENDPEVVDELRRRANARRGVYESNSK